MTVVHVERGSVRASRVRDSAEVMRQVVASVFLVVFSFVQVPGLIAADTKLDLSVDPWGFLGRALSLWDPQGAAGQLQNQAYGYLFPMGPFFGIGHSIGLPPWVVQRLWWCLLLLVSYHGVRLLAERLGIGTPFTRLIAALVYTLAPRVTGGLGAISVELWPMAVAPWVILPLVGVRPGGERRAAGRSALALLCVGGVNAVASGAVLVLPFGFLLLRIRDGVHRKTLVWWAAGSVAAMLWWLVPLLLLGRYSPPFLDWIESASVTTTLASLPEALRGTTHWIAGITGAGGPQWPAAHTVLTSRAGVLAGLELAVLGCWGLLRADLRHARYLRLAAVVGLVLLTLGYAGPLSPPWAEWFQQLLDGPLAPARNIHKFDLVVRLPLALGLAHLLAVVRPVSPRLPWASKALPTVAVFAVISLAAPAAITGFTQARSFQEIPAWWGQAAKYLAQEPERRTLLLPGSNFFTGLWGSPRDEPLQPLAGSAWLVRDAVPLGSAGATRSLTAVENLIATGHGGEELANLLADLGVDRILVRADLDWRATGAPPPLVVRQALAETPMVEPGRTFGPLVGGSFRADVAIDDGIDQAVPTLQVFELRSQPSTTPSIIPAADVGVLSGGPEGVALAGARRSWVLASDRDSVGSLRKVGGASTGAVTDTLQRREANFASVRDVYGPLLAAGQPYSAPRTTHDWLPSGVRTPGDQSTASTSEAAVVTTSSSVATPLFGQQLQLARGPYAATDGRSDTSWVSARPALGSWLRVTWSSSRALPASLAAEFAPSIGADVSAVEIRTEQGSARTPVDPPTTGATRTQSVVGAVPPGASRFVEIRIAAIRGDQGLPAALSELGSGGFSRVLQSVTTPEASGPVSSFELSVRHDAIHPCVRDAGGVARCQVRRDRDGEEDHAMRRTLTAPSGTWAAIGTVTALPGDALNRLLDSWHSVQVTSEDSWVTDPLVRPGNVVDGNPATYWAGIGADPSLVIALPARRVVSRLVVDTDSGIAGSRPQLVRVTLGDRTVERPVDIDGVVTIPRTTTNRITVTVLRSTTNLSVRTGGSQAVMPVVIGEIQVGTDPWPRRPSEAQTGRACGFGPSLVVDGKNTATEVVGSIDDAEAGRPVALRACGPVELSGADPHTVDVVASAEFAPGSLTLRQSRGPVTPQGTASSLTWLTQGPTSRVIALPQQQQPAVLALRENANPGWAATLRGKRLEPVRLDGWRQAWIVPVGDAGVLHLSFEPQRTFVVGMVAGLLAALAVLMAACWPQRSSRSVRSLSGLARPVRGRSADGPTTAFALAAVVVMGGFWGIAAVVAALLARRVLRAGETVLVVVGLTLVGVAAWAPWPRPAATNHGGVAQALALLMLALVVIPAARTAGRQQESPAPSPDLGPF